MFTFVNNQIQQSIINQFLFSHLIHSQITKCFTKQSHSNSFIHNQITTNSNQSKLNFCKQDSQLNQLLISDPTHYLNYNIIHIYTYLN